MRTAFLVLVHLLVCGGLILVPAQTNDRLTPVQREIEKQRQRLNSAEAEERRDALMRLAYLHRSDASHVAMVALNDAVPAVRVAAAHAIVSAPPDEAAALLIPMLWDKLEFIRREAAYALGETHSRSATIALAQVLETDKEMSVRAAAAIALGQIADEASTAPLMNVLSAGSDQKKKSKSRPDAFVMRAAVHSLGEIRSRSSVSALVTTLENESMQPDVRREAASALGLIGDPSAIPALRGALSSSDPYVSAAAREALRRMHVSPKS
jgi:HEAT repeat protein